VLCTVSQALRVGGCTTIEATPVTIAPCPSVAYKYSFHLALSSHLGLLHFLLRVAHSSPLNRNGSQVRNQALTHLCERIFIFIKQRIYATLFSNSIFTTTSLLVGGLIPGVVVPTYEHGEPSMGLLVVDLSSEEEDATPDTSQDEGSALNLFGDLKRGLLGSPKDGNIIILSDSEDE
jgi:hypothetical protein